MVDRTSIRLVNRNFRFVFSTRPEYTAEHLALEDSTPVFSEPVPGGPRNSRSVPRENPKGRNDRSCSGFLRHLSAPHPWAAPLAASIVRLLPRGPRERLKPPQDCPE